MQKLFNMNMWLFTLWKNFPTL